MIFAQFSLMHLLSFNTGKATIDDETEVEARIISMVAETEINYIRIHVLINSKCNQGSSPFVFIKIEVLKCHY